MKNKIVFKSQKDFVKWVSVLDKGTMQSEKF